VKGKVVSARLLTEHHAINLYWGSESIVPRILDLGTRRMWVVSFTPWPFYPQGMRPPVTIG